MTNSWIFADNLMYFKKIGTQGQWDMITVDFLRELSFRQVHILSNLFILLQRSDVSSPQTFPFL